MKTCNKCGRVKPASGFYRTRGSVCRTCKIVQVQEWKRRNPEKVAAQFARRDRAADAARALRYYRENREKCRDAKLRRDYGIGTAEYGAMLAAQDGGCAICSAVPRGRRMAVDHDHETGAVRGLLCHDCNPGLGYFHDDPALLRAAAEYLENLGA